MESQKLKAQKLKCYALGPKSQKFPTAENTRYTVYHPLTSFEVDLDTLLHNLYYLFVGGQAAWQTDRHTHRQTGQVLAGSKLSEGIRGLSVIL